MIMVYGQLLSKPLGSLADGTHAALSGVQKVVLPSLQAVRLSHVSGVCSPSPGLLDGSVVGCAAWSGERSRALNARLTVLTSLGHIAASHRMQCQ